MNLIKIIALVIAFSLNFSICYAYENNTELSTKDEILTKLQSISPKNKTINCNFTQEKNIKGIKNKHIITGKFYLNNNNQMALIYDGDKGDKVIMNNSDFIIVNNGKHIDSSKNPMLKQLGNLIKATMSGDIAKFINGWDIIAGKSAIEYSLRLDPKDKNIKKYVEYIGLVFDSKNMTLNNLTIKMANGGNTTYLFSDKIINNTINSNIFNL